MLTISENAAEVIKLILVGGESPEGAGLRISSSEGEASPESLEAAVANAPEDSDQIVEQSGVRVFLDEQAATVLGDKTLDAERDDNGELGLTVSE
ncbi:Fe-S cluster assembly iron-binding protein IscA [Actinopolyspora lacussalsi]|uniref:Fe-S cluster assembly iron-binding protein IscA n=1 Tax=Actinopolyspora righensis TaxID=995060 RepID=A0A1I7BFY1_9ACTN|nr:HesB/YadR/YfhF-family protein [Actinopolyspora righensis]MDP9640695.1 Fe-S cluster assembly iron-binding protein IscA [Actinopolyspora lacussalsi]SFT86106.1 Fe-S cluster assembly iron-binding protein IscA [Actinopolyspora righensis]